MIASRYSDWMELHSTTRGDITIVQVSGRIDAISSPKLEVALNNTISGGPVHLVLDFSEVEYISSAGLRVLLSIRKRLVPINRELHLAGLKPLVRGVFDMTGFSKIFPLYPTVDDACRHFS